MRIILVKEEEEEENIKSCAISNIEYYSTVGRRMSQNIYYTVEVEINGLNEAIIIKKRNERDRN